jgi:hypothetical protein
MWSAGFCLRHRWAWVALVLFGTAFNFAFGQAPDSVRQAQASPESSPPVKYMAVLRRQAEQGLPPTPTEVAEFWKTSGRMSYQAVKAHQVVNFQRVAARLQREGVTSRPFFAASAESLVSGSAPGVDENVPLSGNGAAG